MHQPFGLIVPVTTLQPLGGLNSVQPAHFWPCGPGVPWYLNCFLLSAANAGAAAAATPIAAAGTIASRLIASMRVRGGF